MDHDQSNCIKILVVDDHFFMREAVTKLLNGEDVFEVCAQASSALEAVQLAEKLTPDIIVMDVSMPEMDGIEATALIRQSQPDAKILALSMHDNEFMRNRMYAAGAGKTAGVVILKFVPGDKLGKPDPAIVASEPPAERQIEILKLKLLLVVSIHVWSRCRCKVLKR